MNHSTIPIPTLPDHQPLVQAWFGYYRLILGLRRFVDAFSPASHFFSLMKLPMKMTLFVASISALLLSACSDPRDPTKENFRAAISAHLEKQSAAKPSSAQYCLPLRGAQVDVNANTARILTPTDDPSTARIRGSLAFALLESLHSTGFASRESQTERTYAREVQFSVYTIDTTRVPIVATPIIGSLEPRAELCGGRLIISDITSFTEPADSPMGRVVTVDTKMRVDSPPPWLTADPMLNALPDLRHDIVEGFDKKFYLVLKDTGWEAIDWPY